MRLLLQPIASLRKISGNKLNRFCEQGWSFIYYSTFLGLGLSIYLNSPYSFNTDHLWIGYPYTLMSKQMKLYYIGQIAFFLHQIVVLHAEKPRKDYLAYLIHHIATIFLLVASYMVNGTRAGNTILVCMDSADLFLSLAKSLLYLKFSTVAEILFGVFVVVWIATRHILYMFILYAAIFKAHYFGKIGYAKGQLTPVVWFLCCAMLVTLQILCIYWLFLVFKVIAKKMQKGAVSDVRSDDEEDDDDDDGDDNDKED